jgi:endonuclease IV
MFGYHVSKNKRTMAAALEEEKARMKALGLPIIFQIFVTGPQRPVETLTKADKEYIRKNANVIIHGAYIDYLWTRKPTAIENLKRELEICKNINARGVIIHLNHKTWETLDVLRQVDTPGVTLWLEVNASKPSPGAFSKPENVVRLFDEIAKLDLQMEIGFVVDTAHLYGSGIALGSAADAAEYIDQLPDVPLAFHLNDSAGKLGSGQDRHAELFGGLLWSEWKDDKNASGCAYILQYCRDNGNICILERDEPFIDSDLEVLTSILNQ